MLSITPRGCPALPVELQEMIIDHLHDDNQALVSCALVCKAWTPRARVNLYTRIELPVHRSASVSSFVKTMRDLPVARELCKDLTFVDSFVDVQVAAEILDLLPDLERLEWTHDVCDRATAGGIGIRHFTEALSSLNSLRYLCSYGSELPARSPISNIPPRAPGFRSLVTFKMYNNSFDIYSPDELNFWLCKAIAEAKRDTTHPQFRHLQECLFTIGYDDILDNLKHMGALMSVVGHHLQTLTFFWEYIPDWPLRRKHLNNSGLSLCKNLQNLTFNMTYPCVYSFKHCAAYLALLPRDAPIWRFTLDFEYYLNNVVEDPAEISEFEEAEVALCRDNYPEGVARLDAAICALPHLQEVTIRLPAFSHVKDSDSWELAQWLRPRFPCIEASTKFKVIWENVPPMNV